MLLVTLSILVLTTEGRFSHARAEGLPVDALGRLIVDDTGVCTAFIVRSIEQAVVGKFGAVETVYENWLVSAGHCAGQELIFLHQGVSHPVAAILGFTGPGRRGHDVMVAALYTAQPFPTLKPAFGEYPQPGDKVMLIGYGRRALMARVGPVAGYDERGHLVIENYASPGNSGGPVLIPGTRRVVGVGIETTLDVRPGTPLMFCRLAGCAVKPPYIAAHIDRVRGVASFP